MKLDNLTFDSIATIKGVTYTVRMRELQLKDCNRLTQIVRNYSENATLNLYLEYRVNKEQTIRNLRKYGLDKVLNVFKSLDEQYQGEINISESDIDTKRKIVEDLKPFIKHFPGEELFSPYDPIHAPFAVSVKEYIENSIQERSKPYRDTFRMGIEIDGSLIGGFVFDLIEKKIEDYITIGDIGIYTEDTEIARHGWRYAVYPTVYFIDTIVKRYGYKGESLYISAITHPCNGETQKMFSKESGFEEVGHITHTDYGPRKTFVCNYSDFTERFLPRPDKLEIKITNALVDGEIDWSQIGNHHNEIRGKDYHEERKDVIGSV